MKFFTGSVCLASKLRAVLSVSGLFLLAWMATCHYVQAAPSLSVTSLGIVSGNRQWEVRITPDASLFSNQPAGLGGSIAAEVGFSVTGTTFVSGTKNAASWPFDNPGNNPFTGNVTNGISLNGNTLFASLGSTFFTSATPVTLLTLVTQGTGPTTVAWGGQTLLTGTPQQYVGGRLAQGGQNFNNITGSISSANPCDLNGDGRVDGADVGLLFNSWGNVAPGTAADKDNSGVVDGADLAAIFNNWTGDVGPTAAVPEPCALGSIVSCAAILGAVRNRSRVVAQAR